VGTTQGESESLSCVKNVEGEALQGSQKGNMGRIGALTPVRGRSAVPVAAAAQIFFEERKACARI
jgi:hypothetical protein